MKKTRKAAKPVSAEAIARLADQGKDVSHFFKGQGRLVQPIRRVNVDVTASMLEELDKASGPQRETPGGDQNAGPAGSRSTLPGATRTAATAGAVTWQPIRKSGDGTPACRRIFAVNEWGMRAHRASAVAFMAAYAPILLCVLEAA
jgi:hypothetical protein